MKKTLNLFILLWGSSLGFAQCDPEVPTIVIDLSSNPDTTWTLFEVNAPDRDGQCCGVPNNENCIQFQITLHPNAAGIFFDYDGAGAFGSLNWRIDCGAPYSLRDTICVTETGPFTLTFCKPGSDNGNYSLISVPKPTFPDDQFVPMNCVQPVEVLGVNASTVQWQSISPGTPGQYNSYLSCTNCLEPTFTPNPSGPTEISYRVCGYPILDYCVGNFEFCDTVKFTIQDSIKLSISPALPAFCSGGSSLLTATATGGDGNFTFIWYNNALQQVGTGSTYSALSPGTYTCEVRDGNFQSGYCDGFFASVVVAETSPPVVNAGQDQVLCAASPNAELSGSFQFASGVVWSGGSGVFQSPTTSANNVYEPTNAEIAAGSVVLTLTSSGVGGGCVNMSDQIELFFVDTVETNLTNQTLLCENGTISLNPTITGGMGPFTYSWTNGVTTSSNTLNEGTHCLTVVDGNQCQTTHCITVSSPGALDIVMSSTPVTVDFGNDGTASVNVTGGVAPYSYLWSNGGTTQTITNLSYGIYTVTVTDDNGCTRIGSVVVNEPRCDGFFLSTSSTNVSCFDGTNGTATVVTNNGQSPFIYSWNDPLNQNSTTAINLTAGVYMITVTDDNACVSISTAIVNEPTPIINTMSHVDVTVQGGNDGQASASVTGGTAPYSYLWSTGSTLATTNSLTAGTHYLTITDDNGCVLEDSVFVNEPPCNTFYALIGTVSPLCNGALTAEAELTLLNGVGPYSIEWSTGQTNVMDISGIAAGFHSVEIIDSRGCEIFQTFGISQPSAISIGLITTPSTCNGFNNGTIDVSINGGTYPYYSFNWSNGATTEDLIGLAPGSFSITVTDLNNCVGNASTIVTEPTIIEISHTENHVTCFEGTDGDIDVTVTGGTLPYNYNWSNGETTQDLSGIDVGGYILNFTDANNCTTSQPLTILIEQPTLVEITDILIDCPAPGASTANVTVTPTGGNGNYAVSFDGGLTYGTYGDYSSMLPVDASYSVIVKDINDCISAAEVISIDTNVVITDTDFNVCYVGGQTEETVTVTIQGGSPMYELSTDNGATFGVAGVTTIDLTIGSNYQLVARDSRSCVSLPISITLPSVFEHTTAVTSNYTGAEISCNGANDGEATAIVTGGTLPYTYTWSNGQNTSVATGLTAGNYTLEIEDAAGCLLNTSVTVSEPQVLTAPIQITTDYNGEDISCFGSSTGGVMSTPTGGTGVYSYSWSGGQTTAGLTNLPAGTYGLTVTDVNGCIAINNITLTQPDQLVLGSISTPVSCNNGSDGSVDLSISGGTLPYSFDWDNGAITEDLSSIVAGVYSVNVEDANGCQVSLNATISQPNALIVTFTQQNVTCNGGSDGSIDINVTGGTTPYFFNWSHGSSSEDLSNIAAGNYSLIVSDNNGCLPNAATSINITEPTLVEITDILIDCPSPGASTANVTVTPTGGNGNYAVSFDGGLTYGAYGDYSSILPVDASYSVVVKDINDCISATEMISIDTNVVITDIDFNVCYVGGQTEETVTVTIQGGSPMYELSTDNGATFGVAGVTTIDLTIGSNYQLVARDSRSCVSLPISITLPSVFEHTTAVTSNYTGAEISCNGANDGEATAIVTGGTLPYTYTWSNGQNTSVATGLTAGNYTLEIEDAVGCLLNTSVTVSEPQVLTAPIQITTDYNGEDISCFGSSTGGVMSTPTGGTGVYSYSWSGGQTSPDMSNLSAGTYDLTVIDENGCIATNSVTLTEPEQLSSTMEIEDVSCNGGSNGSIDLTVSGGVQPYNFDWSNGASTEDLESLTEGDFSVTVTDANGCELFIEQLVVDPTAIDLSIIIDSVTCKGLSDGSINLTANGGTLPYDFNWSNGQDTEDISTLPSGNYEVIVTDANGCFTSISGTVEEPDTISVSSTLGNPTCFGFDNGSIEISINGGTDPYALGWNNGELTTLVEDLSAGTYVLEITDANGCVHNSQYTLTQPTPLNVEITSPVYFHEHNISLFGESDGSIESTVSGGTANYNYLWSTGSTESALTGLEAGEYTVIITDAQGCVAMDTIVLTQPNDLDLPTIFTPNGDNFNDVFEILGIDAYPDNDLTVVNRWGNVVFEATNYANTWSGTNKSGDPLPDGVYFVILKINGGEIERNVYVHIKRI